MKQNENTRSDTRARKPFLTALVSVLVAALAAFVLLPLTSTRVEAAELYADSWSTLKERVSEASDGDVITITNKNIVATETIEINKNITIKGGTDPVTIWRNGEDGAVNDFTDFKVTGGHLTLGSNLTLSGQTGTCSDTSCVDVDQYKQTSQGSGDWTGTIGNMTSR